MTSHRLPLVNTQRSFLSGIRLSKLHGPKVKVITPPKKKKTEVRNSRDFSFEIRKIPFNVHPTVSSLGGGGYVSFKTHVNSSLSLNCDILIIVHSYCYNIILVCSLSLSLSLSLSAVWSIVYCSYMYVRYCYNIIS